MKLCIELDLSRVELELCEIKYLISQADSTADYDALTNICFIKMERVATALNSVIYLREIASEQTTV
jgi:hypothetical protein